jgi:hypothetical protein
MLNRPTWSRIEPGAPSDRSMAVLQYLVAGVAFVAALALAAAH